MPDLLYPESDEATDFFSNDYLAFASDPILREVYLQELCRHRYILGSRGSRLMDGNTKTHVALEEQCQTFFKGDAALVFNSGADANVGIWATLPQPGDVVLFDELIHASMHDGLRVSQARGRLFPFKHNSVQDFTLQLERVMEKTPSLRQGTSSVFVLVDAIYSMHGDFAPLAEIVKVMKELLPPGTGHVYVDEAHSTGTIGPNGSGLTSLLGLEGSISLRLHTFGKAMGGSGAVLICSPIVRRFLISRTRNFIFTTASTRSQLLGMKCAIDMCNSERGFTLRQQLQVISRHAKERFHAVFESFPKSIIHIPNYNCSHTLPDFTSEGGVISPILPIVTPLAASLSHHLRELGYCARPVFAPIVPKGEERIRVTLHINNTEKEVEELIGYILQWARQATRHSTNIRFEPYNIQSRM